MKFRRNQDIYISSSPELNCSTPYSLSSKWIIKECSSSCLIPVKLEPSVVTTHSELFIPGNVLPYGTYELELTVTVIRSSNWTLSTAGYIEIKPSNIAVNLMLLGTSMISHGYQQSLTFDPGTYSVNPDSIPFNRSVSDKMRYSLLSFSILGLEL